MLLDCCCMPDVARHEMDKSFESYRCFTVVGRKYIYYYTANMYSGNTVKTHVKTVKLNFSGLLYHGQVFAIHITTQKCRWYNKPLYFKSTVIPLHLE